MPSTTTPNYRAFVFPFHPVHGLLLLHCTRKRKKGPHYQVPGGHVDDSDYTTTTTTSRNALSHSRTTILAAAKVAAAREFLEETGINLTSPLEIERLTPMKLNYIGNDGETFNVYEHLGRWYFTIRLDDSDFPTASSNSKFKLTPSQTKTKPSLNLLISHEHSGWCFEKDLITASKMVKLHSGGKVSDAVVMAMNVKNTASGNNGGKEVELKISSGVYEKQIQGRLQDDGSDDLKIPPEINRRRRSKTKSIHSDDELIKKEKTNEKGFDGVYGLERDGEDGGCCLSYCFSGSSISSGGNNKKKTG